MGIGIGDNFVYKARKPLDSRDSFDTILDMVSFAESSLDDGRISYVKETDKYYKFNSTNDFDTNGLGRWREYNGGGSSTDEKVKLSSTSVDAHYLDELIDNSTIEVDTTNNCLVIKKIDGQTATVAEINFLTGVTSNIQDQINNLGKSMSMYGVFGTKADLLASTTPVPVDGNTAIVIVDEDNDNKQMTYIYIAATSAWTKVAESSVTVRDFTTNPIDLSTETTGILHKSKIDTAIARLADVLDKTTYRGTGDGIVKQADKLTGLTATIAQLNQAITDSHTHANKTVLDKIVSNGIGSGFLADNGKYISILHVGNTSPTYDSQIWIDTTSTTPILKIFDGTNWITISGASSGSGSVSISADAGNAIKTKTDGLYVKDLSAEVNKINIAQKTVNDVGSVSLLESPVEFTVTAGTETAAIVTNINTDVGLIDNINNYDSLKILFRTNGNFITNGTMHEVVVKTISYNNSDTISISDGSVMYLRDSVESGSNYNAGLQHVLVNCWFKDGTTLRVGYCLNALKNTTSIAITDIIGVKDRSVTIDPVEYVNTESGIEDTPVGHIIEYMGNTAPKHYLACDGSEYNITDYAFLAQHFKEQLGCYNYFGGDGTTTFAVPDHEIEYKSIVPVMSSNEQNGYVASASSTNTDYEAWKAFNKTINDYPDCWITTSGEPTGWIQIELPNPLSVCAFSIASRNYKYRGDVVDFELLGSNDGKNWDTLHSITEEPAWNAGETRTYYFNNKQSYLYYRLNVTKIRMVTSADAYVSIGEFDLFTAGQIDCIKYEPTYFMNINYVPTIADFGNINVSLGSSSEKIRTLWEYTNNNEKSIRIKLSDLVAYTNTGSSEGYLTIEIEDEITQTVYCPTNTYTNISIPEVTIPHGKSIVFKTNWDGNHSSVTWNLTGRFIAISDYSEMTNGSELLYTDEEIQEAVATVLGGTE